MSVLHLDMMEKDLNVVRSGLTREKHMVAANPYYRLLFRYAELTVLPSSRLLDYRPRLTADDIRIHAYINERLAVLQRERHSLWAKARRFLLGDRPMG